MCVFNVCESKSSEKERNAQIQCTHNKIKYRELFKQKKKTNDDNDGDHDHDYK